MAFYDEMAAIALETIAELGTSAVTFSRTIPGVYDPETGTTPNPTELSWPATVAILPASQGTVEAFDIRFDNGTLIETNMRALLVAALGMPHVPAPGDRVTLADGSLWTALGCTPLSPDGATQLIYNVTVRR